MPSLMSSSMADPMLPTPRSSRTKHVIVALVALLGAGIWILQSLRHGSFVADPSGVSMVTNTRPADGETEVLPNSFISAYLNNGHAIDPDPRTLNAQTV